MTNQRINDVDTITTFSGTDRLLINTDVVNNILEQIKKDDFIADIVSTDTNNLIEIGTDNKLFSELPSEAIFGDTIYGGTIVTDLNTINKNGFYTCYGTATGVPSSSYSWFVIHQNSNVGTASATQRAVAYNSTPIIYERVKTSSTWGAWVLQGSGSGGGIVEFDNKGTVTTNITLVENKITTGYWSGTNTITLPTVTDTAKQVTCELWFTTSSTGQPTITNTNLKWTSNNDGKAPSAYSILSGVVNVLTFKSYFEGSTQKWAAEYDTFGGVEVSWTQPTLSANGNLGVDPFAVYCDNVLGGFTWYVADNNPTSTLLFGLGYSLVLGYSNPTKLTRIDITNTADNFMYGYSVFVSDNNITYTFLTSGTSAAGSGATWSINVPIGDQVFKRFYKIVPNTGNRASVYIAQATGIGTKLNT